jgi:hypothetical protein
VRLCAGSRFEVDGIVYSRGREVQDVGEMCPQISNLSDHISDCHLFARLIPRLLSLQWINEIYF